MHCDTDRQTIVLLLLIAQAQIVTLSWKLDYEVNHLTLFELFKPLSTEILNSFTILL
jgi:hypothetical protein